MDNLAQAKEWERLAAMDLSSAEYLLNMHPIPIEIICFHCQQAAEKYLKSYLIYSGMTPPKTHDLDELCKLCARVSDTFYTVADQCSDLTAFGVQPRYPVELIIEEEDMWQALSSAKVIREFVLACVPELA